MSVVGHVEGRTKRRIDPVPKVLPSTMPSTGRRHHYNPAGTWVSSTASASGPWGLRSARIEVLTGAAVFTEYYIRPGDGPVRDIAAAN